MAEALRVENEEQPETGKRVLVAEDSPVTQDLLKLLLGQRGHSVDIAGDGEAALGALRAGGYDVALLDFHLPKLSGLDVAARFREGEDGEDGPRFVAITADVQGLLADEKNCETFDRVLLKPLDIYEVCNVVEDVAGAAAPYGNAAPADVGEPAAPAGEGGDRREEARAGVEAGAILGLGYRFLRWPDDLNAHRLSARGIQATAGEGGFDAILVRAPAGAHELALIWQKRSLHLLPVIDLAGALGSRADLQGSSLNYGETGEVRRLIERFHERRAELHRDLVFTDDLGEKLIGRMFVADAPLAPSHDPALPGLVAYNAVLEEQRLQSEAGKLCEAGFLARTFFDRFHICARCGSSRFNVREECTSCRSPELVEESYLHHFRCAYQGVESDFRQGDALVCPKCCKELSHFSVDYDKPGTVLQCTSCGHAASEPAVGFLCLDCGAHGDGDAMRLRDVYSYTLSEQGMGLARAGQAFLGPAHRTLRFAELPLELVVALNGEAKRYNEEGRPFALLEFSYANERDVVREVGARQFDQARELFLENVRSLLPKGHQVVKGQAYDFALLAGVSPDEAREGVDHIRREAGDDLRLDLGVAVHVFGAEDFA